MNYFLVALGAFVGGVVVDEFFGNFVISRVKAEFNHLRDELIGEVRNLVSKL